MKIHVCLTEEEIARDFFRSLRERGLEERFFYWFPLSVVGWLRLCASKAYRNYARSLSVAEKVSRGLSKKIDPSSVEWVSLGSGQGTKEIPFLEALLQAGKKIRYFPLDSSQSLLEMAVAQGLQRGIPTVGLKANFLDPQHLEEIPGPLKNEIRIVSLFGNTLGNFDSGRFLKSLGARMREGDWLLVDGEIFSSREATLAGYGHSANRRFALAPLLSVGITPADGTLRFELEKRDQRGVTRLWKSFRFQRQKKILYAGRILSFPEGGTLRMSPSYKYTPDGMRRLLEREGLFCVREFHQPPEGRFGLWLAQKA